MPAPQQNGAPVVSLFAICSYNKRPMTQGPRSYMLKTGEAAWGRDPYHLLAGEAPIGEDSRTLCGRRAYGWCSIGPIDGLTADCCVRCATRARGELR